MDFIWPSWPELFYKLDVCGKNISAVCQDSERSHRNEALDKKLV